MDLWEIYKASKGVPHSGDMYDALMGKALGGGSVWETENAPYLFRQSGGALNSRLLNKEKDTIVGASVGWQQLVKSGDVSVSVPSGHKYYANINGSKTIGSSNGTAISINDSTKDNVVDLTLMLGSTIADYAYTLESGTAGAGIAWLKSYGFFDKPYYAYDNGSLQSVNATKKITTGKNLFIRPYKEDRTTIAEVDVAQNADGSVTLDGTVTGGTLFLNFGGINYNELLFGAGTYTLSGGSSRFKIVVVKNGMYYGTTSTVNGRWTFTLTEASKLYFYGTASSGTVFDNETIYPMFELGSTATDYEPYEAHEYTLADLDLRGVFKMDADHKIYAEGDIYPPSGEVQRKWKEVNADSLNWAQDPNRSGVFYAGISDKVSGSSYVICSKYATLDQHVSTNYDKYISGYNSYNKGVFIRDTAYSDKATFVASLEGVKILYLLATPTTETATGFTSPQSVSAQGTEQYIDGKVASGTRDVAVPVGHETEYKVTAI